MPWPRSTVAALLAAALAARILPAAGRKPKPGDMPKGMGMPPGLAGGPPWRQAIDKVFTEACSMNRGAPSVFCFPEKKALLNALQVEQFGIDMTGETYLMDVYVVVNQLLMWPPGWSLLIDVLDPKEPWTRPFCDKIIGGPWWQFVPVVRKSFITPRTTLVQLEKDAPHVAAGMTRWLEDIRKSGNAHTQKLIKEFKDNDAEDAKSQRCTARPMMRMMQQVHAKAVQHILGTACKGSKPAMAKFMQNDMNGLTVLHHVASLGDAAGAKAILKGLPKASRAEFIGRRDKAGYTAEDWARLGDFNDTVEAIGSFLKKGETEGDTEGAPTPEAEPTAAPEPATHFPAAGADDEAATCGSDSASAACSSSLLGHGGWRAPTNAGVPSAWLPPSEQPCALDAIEVSQFDIDVFLAHYMLHPRPLLVRGGAGLPAELARNFTKPRLLELAADRKAELHRFPTEREFDGSKPQVKTLEEYVESLEQRAEGAASKKLHFMYSRLLPEESYLNFSAKLPPILDGKVDHIGSAFFLGGTLMGVPPHHKAPTASSLAFGRKLWFLEPPGREVVMHETAYQHLVRTGGAPSARRCLQEAGDLMFVPRGWTQSWICLGDCIGATHEFSHTNWDLRD
mmetsp:Transcript_77933/g.252756  ORF Transcript_77933/g.252756 Transcript_77933/m.252756 type:complete len:623 (+) Transcript_77933:62-1930(+)